MSIIEIPDDLAGEIDRLAGQMSRSSYATDLLWKECKGPSETSHRRTIATGWIAIGEISNL